MSSLEVSDVEALRIARNVQGLINALRSGDSSVRAAAAEALGEIGDKQAVDPLFAALSDRDRGVRWSAAHALWDVEHEGRVSILNDRALTGEWHFLFSSDSLKIVCRRGGVRVELRGPAKAAQVRDILWNGSSLAFTIVTPSTGYASEHVLFAVDDRNLQGYRLGDFPGRETLSKDVYAHGVA